MELFEDIFLHGTDYGSFQSSHFEKLTPDLRAKGVGNALLSQVIKHRMFVVFYTPVIPRFEHVYVFVKDFTAFDWVALGLFKILFCRWQFLFGRWQFFEFVLELEPVEQIDVVLSFVLVIHHSVEPHLMEIAGQLSLRRTLGIIKATDVVEDFIMVAEHFPSLIV